VVKYINIAEEQAKLANGTNNVTLPLVEGTLVHGTYNMSVKASLLSKFPPDCCHRHDRQPEGCRGGCPEQQGVLW